jgi:AraC family transcriptional regulator
MLGYRSTVVSEFKLSGVTVQRAINHWKAGVEISDCEADLVLRWRVKPYLVKLKAHSRPGGIACPIGQLMVHPAHVKISALAAQQDETIEVLICRLNKQLVRSVLGEDLCLGDIEMHRCVNFHDPYVDYAMRRLLMEIMRPGFASSALIESLGQAIAIDLSRTFKVPERDQPVTSALSKRQLNQIHDFVCSFTEGSPSLSDVAGQMMLSTAHLRRIYKQSTGQTLHRFIEEIRISRAKSLLAERNISLKEISYRLGFSHPSAFSFAFKRATGETPNESRARCAGSSYCAA